MKKRILIIGFALIVLLCGTVSANTIYTDKDIQSYIDKTAKRQMSVASNPGGGSVGGDWTVMGLALSGKITEDYKNRYLNNLETYVEEKKGVLSTKKYTEYSRVIIALTSIGVDASNFCGYNLVKPLGEAENVARQGLNGVAYALIALECGNYANPKVDADYKGRVGTREWYKDALVGAAKSDGGWTLMGNKSDVDMTAIVIQALAPYYHKDKNVKEQMNKAWEFLSENQMEDGGFKTMGNATCESCAQTIVALSSVGIKLKDKRFVKNGNVLDALLDYYDDSTGGFRHIKGSKVNQLATDQSMYALVASRGMLESEEAPSAKKPFYNFVAKKNKKQLKVIKKHSLKKNKSNSKNNSKNSNASKNGNDLKEKSGNNIDGKQSDLNKKDKYNNSKNKKKKDINNRKKNNKNNKSNKKSDSSNSKITDDNATKHIQKAKNNADKNKKDKNVFVYLLVCVGIIVLGTITYVGIRRRKNV